MLAIIPNKKIYFSISVVLFVLSIASLLLWGLKLGIDFTGGSMWEVEFKNQRPDNQEIMKALADFKLDDAVVQPTGDKGLILKFRSVNENTHAAMKSSLNILSPLEEKKFDSVDALKQQIQKDLEWALD